MSNQQTTVFSIDQNTSVSTKVSELIGKDLERYEIREFSDREFKIRPLTSVRRSHCIIFGSICSSHEISVNDALCHYLFFIGSLLDAGASEVSAIVPYLAYSRKDRRSKSRDPLSLRYVAQLLEAIGLSRLVVIDAHNESALQNAFRIPTDHLQSATLFAKYLAPSLINERLMILSPDIGGIPRAKKLMKAITQVTGYKPAFQFLEKLRTQDTISGEDNINSEISNQIRNKTIIIIDDIISTGKTARRAANICKKHGAYQVIVAATHGLFCEESEVELGDQHIDRIIVSNSVLLGIQESSVLRKKIEFVDVSSIIAHAIESISSHGSISDTLIY